TCGNGRPMRGVLDRRRLKPKTVTTTFQSNILEFRFEAARLEGFDSVWVHNLRIRVVIASEVHDSGDLQKPWAEEPRKMNLYFYAFHSVALHFVHPGVVNPVSMGSVLEDLAKSAIQGKGVGDLAQVFLRLRRNLSRTLA